MAGESKAEEVSVTPRRSRNPNTMKQAMTFTWLKHSHIVSPCCARVCGTVKQNSASPQWTTDSPAYSLIPPDLLNSSEVGLRRKRFVCRGRRSKGAIEFCGTQALRASRNLWKMCRGAVTGSVTEAPLAPQSLFMSYEYTLQS